MVLLIKMSLICGSVNEKCKIVTSLCLEVNNTMKDSFHQWHVHNLWRKAILTFATLHGFFCLFVFCLSLTLIQQILPEQWRSFIKGLGNKDSIELLRYDGYFLIWEDVFFPWDYGQLGLPCLLPLHYLKDKHKLKWKLSESCFISSRIRTLILL